MQTIRIIELFYLLYTIYTLYIFLISDYSFVHAFFGIVSIWFVLLIFGMGYYGHRRIQSSPFLYSEEQESFFLINKWSGWRYIVNASLCWIFSILSAEFYVGQDLATIVYNLNNGISVYYEYQNYFKNAGLSEFSLEKIPYVFMLTYLTITLIFSMISVVLDKKKINMKQLMYLISVNLSYLFFGICRGTNFEMYTVFVLATFCLLKRQSITKINYHKNNTQKKMMFLFVIGIIMILVFQNVVSNRGMVLDNTICPEIRYMPDQIVSQLMPEMTKLAIPVFSYLGYGIFVIGVMVDQVLFASFENFLGAFIPYGYALLNDDSLKDTMFTILDIGVRWIPDYIGLLDLFGFFILFIVLFLLGNLIARMEQSGVSRTISNLLSFVVFMEMISIPVGKFIINSTPNILTVLFIIVYSMKCMLIKTEK